MYHIIPANEAYTKPGCPLGDAFPAPLPLERDAEVDV